MTDLQAGWKRVRFAELAECVNDRVDDPAKAGVDRYVGLDHLDPESLKIRRWGAPEDVESTKLRFKRGDIIFGKRRAYQRKLAVADFEGICSAHAMVLRAKPSAVAPEFLPYFMQSDAFMERAIAISVGSLSPTINWKSLALEEFDLPPLHEQRRIATLLVAAEHAAQSCITLADSLHALVDAYSSTAFRGQEQSRTEYHRRLGVVSADWPVVTIGSVTESTQYGLSVAPNESGAYPILRMMNLVDGRVVENDIRFVDLPNNQFEDYRLELGDVLFNRTNSIDLVGRTGTYALSGDHVFASYLVRLKVRTDVVRPEYVTAYLNSPLGRQQVLSFATKAVSQANVSASNLAKVLLPLPPLESQDRILADLQMLHTAVDSARERGLAAKQQQRALMTRPSKGESD